MLDKDMYYIKVKAPWKSISALLIMLVDEKNPGDNGYMMKRVISPVQYF